MRWRSVAALLALALLVTLPVQAQENTKQAQESPNWTIDIKGAPRFPAGALGYFIWTDGDGWHLRWTTRGATHRFSGAMTTDGAILRFRRVGIERGDTVRHNGNTVVWDAGNTGYTDGFDFALAASADWLRFSLQIDGRPASLNQIFLGLRGAHPDDNPFVLRRLGWPEVFRGQPDVRAGEALGYFVWFDGDGWHVRWTTRGRTRRFAGLVSSDSTLYDVRRVRMERGDLTARGPNVVAWEAGNTGHLDGFDFRANGDRLTFTLRIDGTPAAVSQIFIGDREAHPGGNPFTVNR